ncbi:hypothetical protein GAY28_07860 [Azospirillum brasilense]|nr:hypothetical protein [Azospirillum brasilense]
MLPCKDGTCLPNAFRRAPSVTSYTSNHLLAANHLTAAPMNDPGSFGSYYRMSGGARPLGEDQIVTAILHDEMSVGGGSLAARLNLW